MGDGFLAVRLYILEDGGPGGIRTHDSRIKSPLVVRCVVGALARYGKRVLEGLFRAESSRRVPDTADEGILS